VEAKWRDGALAGLPSVAITPDAVSAAVADNRANGALLADGRAFGAVAEEMATELTLSVADLLPRWCLHAWRRMPR
jgi:hypothetical protein